MSLAKKCDRCGVCFDPFNVEGRIGRFFNPIFQTSNDIREQVRGQLLDETLGVDGIVDLCPNCASAFRAFMNRNPNPDNLPARPSLQSDMLARVKEFQELVKSATSNLKK